MMDPSPPQKKMFCYNLTLKKRTYLKFYEHSLPKSFMPAFSIFGQCNTPSPLLGCKSLQGKGEGKIKKKENCCKRRENNCTEDRLSLYTNRLHITLKENKLYRKSRCLILSFLKLTQIFVFFALRSPKLSFFK